jgi:hypothetical protein
VAIYFPHGKNRIAVISQSVNVCPWFTGFGFDSDRSPMNGGGGGGTAPGLHVGFPL